MTKMVSLLMLITSIININAQQLYINFDNQSIELSKINEAVQESEYAHASFTPSYSTGIKGLALDLTEDVAVRIPLVTRHAQVPDYNRSFSAEVWVKTKPGARQGTVIMSNKKSDAPADSGWTIGTNDRGAWYFNISDGKNTFAYEPTFEKQAVNDGKWHYLAVSVDMDKKELWLYFDGRNVAIYNIDGLAGAASKLSTVIGGTDEYNDWGSRGEWTAFNGFVDEVRLQDKTISAGEVKSNYSMLIPGQETNERIATDKLKIQVWNIWHGGRRFGKHVGVQRVVDVLKKENADIIGLVETYGSGAIIADSLGYYFYLISSNLSIMSRYPIAESVKVFKPFFSGGAVININESKQIAFFDIWLNYSPDVCDLHQGKQAVKKILEKEKNTRLAEINRIIDEIQPYIVNADKVPVIVAGDFNCGSHLDWKSEYKELHNGLSIEWPVSQQMLKAGFGDSYRQMNPNVWKAPGFTWSPLINQVTDKPNCVFDRIDFIYYLGKALTPYRSEAIDHHPVFWPSDHGSVISYFYLN